MLGAATSISPLAGSLISAVLSIRVPIGVPKLISTSKIIDTELDAGTVMLVISITVVDELFVAPAGKLMILRLFVAGGM